MRGSVKLYAMSGLVMIMATASSAVAQQSTPPTATPTPAPPIRIFRPVPAATPTPSPTATPTPTAPAIRVFRPVPTATPTPAPTAPVRIGQPGGVPAATGRPSATPPAAQSPIRTLRPTTPAVPPVIQPGVIGAAVGQTASANDLKRFTPTDVGVVKAPADTVTLRTRYSDLVKAVPVLNQWTLQNVKLDPKIKLGSAKLNLTPVLTRKGALPVVAQALQTRPGLGRVNLQDVEVSLIGRPGSKEPRGLVLRTFLNYEIAPGACADARRGQIEQIGLRCASRYSNSPAAIDSRYATKGDVHYVADPVARQQAVNRALADSTRQAAEIAAEVTNFRASLANPATKAAVEAQFGAAQLQKLVAMPDEDLAGELINASEQKVEQTLYVPFTDKLDTINYQTFVAAMNAMAAVKAEPQKVVTDTPIKPTMFLTGFTLGRRYEWSQQVETTIKWCVVGCKKHYYVRAYAWFEYGFGLRFPIKLTGNYHYEAVGSSKTATFTPDFFPVNGNPDDYTAAGLEKAKLFDGAELVARAGVGAGFSAHIPIYPDPPSIDFEISEDFTKYLPAPLTNGQFTPPAAGTSTAPARFVFDQFDILGGRLNFGILGAQVFPVIEIRLQSESLSFDFHDDIKNTPVVPIVRTSTNPVPPIPVAIDANGASSFTLSNPVYNLSALLTPGINPRLFLDLGVWGNTWDFPIMFPELSIEIPKGGVNFACHEGTTCKRQFQFATVGGKTLTGAGAQQLGAIAADIENWPGAFVAKWQPRCADNGCVIAVQQAAGEAVDVMSTKLNATDPDSPAQVGALKDVVTKAKRHADGLAAASITIADIEAWGPKFDAKWQPQCVDDTCTFGMKLVRVGSVLAQKQQFGGSNFDGVIWAPAIIGGAAADIPDSGTIGTIRRDAEKTAATLVKESLIRKAAQAQAGIAALAQAIWIKKCKDADCVAEITGLTNKMTPRAKEVAAQNPTLSPNQVIGIVGKEFTPQFQAAVDRSAVRAQIDGLSELTEAVWTQKCADNICVTNIKALVAKMLVRARELQKLSPDLSFLQLNGMVSKEYTPKFQGEVQASEIRKIKLPASMKLPGGTKLKPGGF